MESSQLIDNQTYPLTLIGRNPDNLHCLRHKLRSIGYCAEIQAYKGRSEDLTPAQEDLILLDENSITRDETARLLEHFSTPQRSAKAALINYTFSSHIYSLIDYPALRGVFKRQIGAETLRFGIQQIRQGAYYFPHYLADEHSKKEQTLVAELPERYEPTGSSNLVISLTERQIEILNALINGATNAQIAARLNISPNTVRTHIYNCFQKIGVSSRTEAVRWALEYL